MEERGGGVSNVEEGSPSGLNLVNLTCLLPPSFPTAASFFRLIEGQAHLHASKYVDLAMGSRLAERRWCAPNLKAKRKDFIDKHLAVR